MQKSPATFYGHPLPRATGPWAWTFSPDIGHESPSFASRLDAQGWLGENLNRLGTASVAFAQLTRHGQAVGQAITLDQKHAE